MKKIIITEKNKRYIAHQHDQPKIFASGETALEAIGRLILKNSNLFGIKVEYQN